MNKKIPAIRANIGSWKYYTATLTFEDISKYVKKIDKELHNSDSLNEAIQRTLTNNYISIKNYILNQEERFFNSLVLAIYDGKPNWIEVELEIEDEYFYNLGFLSLSGEEQIFPVDGQHRVEGIREALKNNPKLKDEKISVIFIGHQKTEKGMEKSRRLFNALNRYAKPVSISDIIALDEDDSAAITTRFLLEESEKINLFKGSNVIYSKQKGIPSRNKEAFTSLVTLYQCNFEILKYYFREKYRDTESYTEYKNQYFSSKKKITEKDFIRYRPDDEFLTEFKGFTEDVWGYFNKYNTVIKEYLRDLNAAKFRNMEDGGNILFRPIGILPFIEAIFEYSINKDITLDNTFEAFSQIELNLNKRPWRDAIWSPQGGKMRSSINKTLMKNLFIYLVDNQYFDQNPKKKNDIKERYANYIAYKGKIEDISLKELLGLK